MTEIIPPLGIAHFSCIDVPPLQFVRLAGEIGYAAVGLRLHPAFQGAPFYTLRPGSAEMRSVKMALQQAGIAVYDIEFVVIDEAFSASELLPVLESAGELGARRLSVCGDDAETLPAFPASGMYQLLVAPDNGAPTQMSLLLN